MSNPQKLYSGELLRANAYISSKLYRLNHCIKGGLLIYDQEKTEIEKHTKKVSKVMETLSPVTGTVSQWVEAFIKIEQGLRKPSIKNPIAKHMTRVTQSFGTGLFVGSDDAEIPHDNLDLERWFKEPKGHERRIHGRKMPAID